MRRFLLWGLLMLFSCLVTRQGATDDDGPGPKIYNDYRRAVVKVVVKGTPADLTTPTTNTGTGFLVSRSGYILTASHVLGQDSEWHPIPGGVDRTIEVLGLSDTDSMVEIAPNATIVIQD